MFVARYQFIAKFPQSISFAPGDHFLGLRKENDYWFYVFHEDGRLGAIPTNYVEESNVFIVSRLISLVKITRRSCQNN